jgi:hypothetical protein
MWSNPRLVMPAHAYKSEGDFSLGLQAPLIQHVTQQLHVVKTQAGDACRL